MGGERTTVRTETKTDQTQRATATPEETELNKLALERQRAVQGRQIEAQQQGFNLINQLLTGSSDLPGIFGDLATGVSAEAIGQRSTDLARQNLANFQSLGIADSGTAFKETARDIATSILLPVEQSNIGNLFNLLNLGVGGQAQVQSGALASSQGLGNRLAGLRTINTQGFGSGTQTTIAPNPFLSSLQTSLGQSIGKGVGGFLFA